MPRQRAVIAIDVLRSGVWVESGEDYYLKIDTTTMGFPQGVKVINYPIPGRFDPAESANPPKADITHLGEMRQKGDIFALPRQL
jgi:hypothetical protein